MDFGIGAFLVTQLVKNSAMQETQFQFLGREDPLEKGMATHYCILAWRIPWTEEPGGPQSVGSQRVGHDGAAFASRSLHHLLLSTVGSELSVGRASGPRGLLSV